MQVGAFLRSGEEVPVCEQCGLILDGTGEQPGAARLPSVLIAEDTELLRTMLEELFVSEGVAETAVACANGEKFLEEAARTYRKSGEIGLVVLDANMPILDGYRAALALRAIERGLGVRTPTPILFFTSVPCDEPFRKVLERCAPARYVNKETSSGPKELVDRIRQILASGS